MRVGARGVFFFQQKTAYEMRSSDWTSDVCSSDLLGVDHRRFERGHFGGQRADRPDAVHPGGDRALAGHLADILAEIADGPARSDERSVGKECVSTCGTRGPPDHEKQKTQTLTYLRSALNTTYTPPHTTQTN